MRLFHWPIGTLDPQILVTEAFAACVPASREGFLLGHNSPFAGLSFRWAAAFWTRNAAIEA